MNSVLIQYIAVFIILALVVVWIIYRLFSKKGRRKSSPCCGCSLSNSCKTAGKKVAECNEKKQKKDEGCL